MEKRYEDLLKRAVMALETIAKVLATEREREAAPVVEAMMAAPAPQVTAEFQPLAQQVARLAEGIERMMAVNAELAATRREHLAARMAEHKALMEAVAHGAMADGSEQSR